MIIITLSYIYLIIQKFLSPDSAINVDIKADVCSFKPFFTINLINLKILAKLVLFRDS